MKKEGVAAGPSGGPGAGGGGGRLARLDRAGRPGGGADMALTDAEVAEFEANFPVSDKRGISGHSMGGHGALICALRNPGRYQSLSAFAPISNPSNCPWGEKALAGYLGQDTRTWRKHDTTALLEDGARVDELLVDIGDARTRSK